MNLVLLAAVVLRLSHTDPQNIQELATIARSTADIRELSVNAAERSITFNGTPQQNAIAEWLVPQLDFSGRHPAGAPYKVDTDDIARVFFTMNTETQEQLIELATTARSLAEVRRTFVYQPSKAIVARGTAAQITLMEWLLPQLDVAEPQSGSPQHYVGGKTDDIARLFYANHTQTVQELVELTTVIRSTAEIRRAFIYTKAKAVALRGAPEQIALAEFLIANLNRRSDSPLGSGEHRIPGEAEGVVRLFAIKAATVAEFQQKAKNIREATGIRRAFTYIPHRALIVRGTPEQVAEAERLIRSPNGF
jgi:hypothetical protein